MNKHDSQEKPFDPRPVQDFVFKMLPTPEADGKYPIQWLTTCITNHTGNQLAQNY